MGGYHCANPLFHSKPQSAMNKIGVMYISLLLLTASTLTGWAQSASQVSRDDQKETFIEKADSLLHRTIELQEHVGITAGVYIQDQLSWTNGAGVLNLKSQDAAGPDMIHRIASISKSMTAVAVLQLYEQGKLELDVPIQSYVPEFPKKTEGDITVRHLLTHTSGIGHYKGMLDGISFKEYPTLLDAMKKFQQRDLKGKPGDIYQYTTYGYVVLGVVIEKVSGMSYEAYMKQHIWEPAGMLHTSKESKEDFALANKSSLYRITDKGKIKKDPRTNLSVKTPGGGLQSTAGDLLRFGQALIDHRLLKPETMELMLVDPGIREEGNPYAMGWFIYQKDTNEKVLLIGHSGSQAGTSSQLLIMPERGIVSAVISNTRNQWYKVIGLCSQLLQLSVDSFGKEALSSSDR